MKLNLLTLLSAGLMIAACAPSGRAPPTSDSGAPLTRRSVDIAATRSSPPDAFESHDGDLDCGDLLGVDDRRALDEIDQTWSEALARVRADGRGEDVSTFGKALDPGAVREILHRPEPANYVCRLFELGEGGGQPAITPRHWF